MSRFNQTSMENIMRFIHKKQYSYALDLLLPYCEQYPKDNSARTLCIHTLLSLGLTTDARIMLETTKIDKTFVEDTKKSLYFANVKLLIIDGKYQECLDYMLEHDNKFYNEDEIYYARAFCKKRLGLPIYASQFNSYLYQQILDYSIDKFYNNLYVFHIKEDINGKTFNKDFLLDKAIEIINKLIDESVKIYRNLYFYEITFKCDGCGVVEHKQANYLKVSYLNGSKDMMFLYPSLNDDKVPYIDISNFLFPEESVVKRLSQIDKFYKKYNIR